MRGFTLLELLVVLLLVGLALGLIVPRLERAFSPPARPFPQEVEKLLADSREQALVKRRSLLVLIDPEERAFLVVEPPYQKEAPRILKRLAIPERYEVKEEGLLEIEGLTGVLFLADGTSSGGEIELIDRDRGRQTLLRLPRALFYVERRSGAP